ncbi:hypothetical protein VKT23_016204 [Stygiomarasmius scandens]|uniref:SAM domain-containing protein n=1 Tax=Marasmiellus scandens TaxID=2682957 RepID=A0ABR1IZY7_9AGAR
MSNNDKDEVYCFNGDLYGRDYTAEDFPGFHDVLNSDDGGSDSSGSESDTGDDEDAPGLEKFWEPEREHLPTTQPEEDMEIDSEPQLTPSSNLNSLLHHLPAHCDGICITKFGGRAGETLPGSDSEISHDLRSGFSRYQSKISDNSDNIWAPFTSRIDWEVARWAKMHKTGSTAFSDLLAIDGVNELLGLSYKNSTELNNIIDKSLPSQQLAFY